METCVLIPAEFSLVLSPQTNETNANRLYEMGVQVWSNQRISKGETFSPYQGTIRLDTLEVYSLLDDNDVRFRFGCYDEIQEVDDRTVRHCNWIRFLRCSETITEEVNLVGKLVEDQAIYETLCTVLPNTEMIVYFEQKLYPSRNSGVPQPCLTSTPINARDENRNLRRTRQALEDSPLDLSVALVSSPCSSMSISSGSEERRSTSKLTPSIPLISSPLPSIENDSFKASDHRAGETVTTTSNKPKSRERNLLPCEYCGKAFDRPSLLRRHLRTHTGEKPHVCDVCGKGFSTSSSLNTHRRIHSGEKPHQCHICGKRFTASSNLYYHRMTHNKEKPHKCTVCSKSFPTPGDLKSHMYVHNGSWPFKCHVCNRGFSKQTNLRNHLFLHTGDRPHVCEICQKRFALACNLKAHLKTHEEVHSEKCHRCGSETSFGDKEESLNCHCQNIKEFNPRYHDDSRTHPNFPSTMTTKIAPFTIQQNEHLIK